MKLCGGAGRGFTKQSRGWALALLAGGLLAAARAQAADFNADDVGDVAAIQNRTYHLGQEFEFSVSFLPDDAFYKAVTPEFSYTFHFSDQFAWEAARVGYALRYDTNLKSQLLALQVAPTFFEEVQLFLSSDVIWSPLYGKLAAFNRYVIYGELYGVLGGGAFETSSGNSLTSGGTWDPSGNVGLGLRLFLNQTLSVRLEVRENLLFEQSGVTSVVDLNLGLGINFGSAE